jgi:hypothetical protein
VAASSSSAATPTPRSDPPKIRERAIQYLGYPLLRACELEWGLSQVPHEMYISTVSCISRHHGFMGTSYFGYAFHFATACPPAARDVVTCDARLGVLLHVSRTFQSLSSAGSIAGLASTWVSRSCSQSPRTISDILSLLVLQRRRGSKLLFWR